MSKRGVAPLLGAMAIVVLLVLGGCGGSDDESTTAAGSSDSSLEVKTTSLSASEYKSKANQICGQQTEKVVGVVRKAIRTQTPVKVSTVLPAIEEMHDKLVALGAPEGETEQIEAFLVALGKDIEEAEGKPSASTDELAVVFKQSGDLARKQGLPSCGLGG